MGLGAGLGAPGSGFPSEESEESRILQPPQYFWEEEEELNDSSLDLGPTAGSSSHLRVGAHCSWECSWLGKMPEDHFLAQITSLASPCQLLPCAARLYTRAESLGPPVSYWSWTLFSLYRLLLFREPMFGAHITSHNVTAWERNFVPT